LGFAYKKKNNFMAKKKVDQSVTSEDFSFRKFNDALSKIQGFELGDILETSTFSKIDEYIPTGSYTLNAQISGSLFGGYPNSRSVGLVGDPETGKTFMCLNAVREAQKMNYYVIYCETEGAIDRSTAEKLGIDTSKIRYQPIKTVNEFKRFTVQVIENVKTIRKQAPDVKFMIVLDSLGMLTTEKDINDALAGKDAMDMGIKAKQLRAMFRLITLDLAAHKIPLIVTNHTTIGNIGSYTGPTKESAGGDGPVFSLSTVLLLSKKYQREGEGKDRSVTGIIIDTFPKKTRSTIPKKCSIHVGFVSGMNPYVGLEEYVSWEACGIERGKIYTKKDYEKELAKAKGAALAQLNSGVHFQHTPTKTDKSTGEITQEKTVDLVFVPNESGRWCVRHMGKSLQNGSMLFNKDVFTDQVLRDLDENVIKPTFKLPDWVDPNSIDFELDDEKEYEE
jgi:RecA/RadA recombinase